jgi:hypothetical protein
MMAVRKGPYSAVIEYGNWAPVVSYLFDLTVELEEQCNADDIPWDRRASLAVCLTGLNEVLDFGMQQVDLLKLKGEKANAPQVVEAVTEALHGVDDLPLQSVAVRKMMKEVATLQVAASLKAAAKTVPKADRAGASTREDPK